MIRFACLAAAFFAHPASIAGFPIACAVWWYFGLPMEPLLVVLSVLAISMTQLILMSSDHDTKAMQRKLDELIHATDQADDAVAEIEKEDQ